MTNFYSQCKCYSDEASYYFFHIPKTAGTSLIKILENVFSPEDICPPQLWCELIKYQSTELSKFRLFRGHFYTHISQVVNQPLKAFVFFRDPLDRALSHYGHVTKHSQHYLHNRSKELKTLTGFLKDPVTRETVRNFQAKCLVGYFDIIKTAATFSSQDLAKFALEEYLETTPLDISDEELFAKAKDAVDSFCCIGITEHFEESVKLLANIFEWDLKSSNDFLNTNSERPKVSKISPEDTKLLESLNLVDTQLYNYALSKFKIQVREHNNIAPKIESFFISYSQNFEDVMLWRALKHIDKGFYIDIGAQDPVVDSVSMAFYEHGWRGVHVEPTLQYSEKLRIARPDETVFQLAIGHQVEALSFYEFKDTGLSTADIETARRHQEAGFNYIQTQVPVITLDALFEAVGAQDIHWMKLDVEGMEKDVLESWKLSNVLPWLLVIESTRPSTQIESHEEWEALLFNKGYQYVYFDGLNRFYVSPHHAYLSQAFTSPPNIFDGFVLSGKASQPFYKLAEDKVEQAEAEVERAEAKAKQAEARILEIEATASEMMASLRNELHQLQQINNTVAQLNEAQNQYVQVLLNSSSWRITAPLRYLILIVKRVNVNYIKSITKKTLQHSALYVRKRPNLSKVILKVLNSSPKLKLKLYRAISFNSPGQVLLVDVPIDLAHITPHARKIYANIKDAMGRHKRESI